MNPSPSPQDIKLFFNNLVLDQDLFPQGQKTFCNLAAKKTALFFGCHDFDAPDILADDLYHLMAANISGGWSRVNSIFASDQAQAGMLVFAVLPSWMLDEEHGHIAAVYPAPMQYSQTLGRNVCVVANVGKNNGIFRSTLAFPPKIGEARNYIWSPGQGP